MATVRLRRDPADPAAGSVPVAWAMGQRPDALNYARVDPVHPEGAENNRLLGQELRDLFGGTRSAREVLTVANQRLSAMLCEWGEHA